MRASRRSFFWTKTLTGAACAAVALGCPGMASASLTLRIDGPALSVGESYDAPAQNDIAVTGSGTVYRFEDTLDTFSASDCPISDSGHVTTCDTGTEMGLVIDSGAGTDSASLAAAPPYTAGHIQGGDGAKAFTGGDGPDRIYQGAGPSVVHAGPGADVLIASFNDAHADDTLDGGPGDDSLTFPTRHTSTPGVLAGVSVDLAAGTAGQIGTSESDALTGIEDVLGGPGPDVITGDSQANKLDGGMGDDVVDGGGGNDVLRGGPGRARYEPAGCLEPPPCGQELTDTDQIDGGGGDNTVVYARSPVATTDPTGDASVYRSARVRLSSGDTYSTGNGEPSSENDRLRHVQNAQLGVYDDIVYGDDGPNRIDAGAGDDIVDAGDGNDVVTGGPGPDAYQGSDTDVVDGGAGTDTIDYSQRPDPLSVSLAGTSDANGSGDGSENDRILGVENAVGGAGDDLLSGGPGPNRLEGRAGNDVIKVRDGVADVADCGSGSADVALVDAHDTVDSSCESSIVSDDVQAPFVSVQGPAEHVSSSTAVFEIHAYSNTGGGGCCPPTPEQSATMRCKLDHDAELPCQQGTDTFEGLAIGEHVLRVTGTDTAGNTSEAVYWHWTVDPDAPAVMITSGPPPSTTSGDATFEFSASTAVTFRCRLDDKPEAVCASPTHYAGLGVGAHKFVVVGMDASGNVSAPETWSWSIVASPLGPGSSLTEGPGSPGETITRRIRRKAAPSIEVFGSRLFLRTGLVVVGPATVTVKVTGRAGSGPRRDIGHGSKAIPDGTAAELRVRLTALGKRLLARHKRVALRMRLVVTAPGAKPIVVTRGLHASLR